MFPPARTPQQKIRAGALACLLLCACGAPAPKGAEAFAGPSLRTESSDNGVEIQVIAEGTGPAAKEGDWVRLHYRLTLEDGSEVDSSHARKPLGFFLGRDAKIIKGFHAGAMGMKLGELRKARIPHHLGYGDREVGPIPAKSNLIFELELMQISNGTSPGVAAGES